MTVSDPERSPGRGSRTAREYRAALDRLARGEPRHPAHVGRTVRITPASVAREAGRSRNPLYTTHRAILEEIAAAVKRPTPSKDLAAVIAELRATIADLRERTRLHAQEKRALATENLMLLHRARAAEDTLAARDRELGELRARITVGRSVHGDDAR
jgi:hypothetical protein